MPSGDYDGAAKGMAMHTRLTTRLALVASMALAPLACKKEKSANTPANAAPRADTSALWKLAPDGTTVALVVGAGAGELIRRGADTVLTAVSGAPGAADMVAEMKSDMPPELRQLLESGGAAKAGIDLSKGGAFFFGPSGEPAMVLPVTDRAKFRAFADGEQQGELDVFDDGPTCRMVGSFYACSEDRGLLDAVGKGKGLEPPSGRLQGHVEFWLGESPSPDLPPEVMTDYRGARAAALIEPGGVTIRALASGTPGAPLREQPSSDLISALAAKKPTGVLTVRATSLWNQVRASIPGGALGMPLPGGVALGDLVGAFSGEVVGYALPGEPGGVIKLGMSDTGPAAKLVGACESLVIGPVTKAALSGDRCTLTVQVPDVPMDPFDVQLWVGGSYLGLGIGDISDRSSARPIAAIANELIVERWTMAAWGYGSIFSVPGIAATQAQQIGEIPEEAKVALWAGLHLSELGFALRGTDDGVEMMTRFRTVWSYSDDILGELEPIISAVAGGDFTAAKKVGALADKHPGSRLAADVEGGAGIYASAGLVGVLTAVAVPAFMKYIKKSKTSEARMFVKKMYDGARAYYMDPPGGGGSLVPTAPTFPPKSTAITPPLGTCCSDGAEKCVPSATYWTDETWVQLYFSVDDPHYYSYQYEAAPDGQSFTVRAYGDLDCDGVYSTFEMYGQAKDGEPRGNAGMFRERETE